MPSAAEEDYLRNFNAIITKGRKDNTYKFALARFLIDYSESLDEQSIRNKVDSNTDEVIEYSLIAKAFLRYYWHQICKYKIKQNFNSEKLPLIVQIIQGNKAASRPLFYEYDRIAIHVKPGALLFFKQNYSLLFKAVILEWAKFLEVVYRFAELRGVKKEELERIRQGKEEMRGAFTKNLFLIETG